MIEEQEKIPLCTWAMLIIVLVASGTLGSWWIPPALVITAIILAEFIYRKWGQAK